MKLLFLIILLCGITSTPVHTVNKMKAGKACTCHAKAITVKTATANLDIVPSGLIFQF